jgi:hypothetical protein
MAESFVKRMKHDFVAFMPKPDATTVVADDVEVRRYRSILWEESVIGEEIDFRSRSSQIKRIE